MEFALIRDNVVVNTIIAEQDFIDNIKNEWQYIVDITPGTGVQASIGYTYVNGVFNKPEEIEHIAVPSIIQMRQLQLGLLKRNKLANFTAAIPTLPSPDKEEVEIEWQYATSVARDGWVNKVAQVIGFSQNDLDSLFIESSSL